MLARGAGASSAETGATSGSSACAGVDSESAASSTWSPESSITVWAAGISTGSAGSPGRVTRSLTWLISPVRASMSSRMSALACSARWARSWSESAMTAEGSSSQSSTASMMPSRSGVSASRSDTHPTPSRMASGSHRSQGARTKARSLARGCGRVRTGSEEARPSIWMMSMSTVRAPQRSWRSRPSSRSMRLVWANSSSGVAIAEPTTTAFQ